MIFFRPKLRTLLVLGRASNIPTVWSNVLAGWLLGDGGTSGFLLLFLTGASLMYTGGMYLNDAFDAGFDREFRRERPIPSGAVTEIFVWRAGWGMMALGAAFIAACGWSSALLALLLGGSILLYNWAHKHVTFSPVLMSLCRFLLFLGAASTSSKGITGTVVWSGLALAGWIIGLSYIARRESRRGAIAWWPIAPLAFPWILAILLNDGPGQWRALVYSGLLAFWAFWCLRYSFRSQQRAIGRTVAGLLAAICLTDLLALAPEPSLALVFIGLFVLSLVGQRFIPAT